VSESRNQLTHRVVGDNSVDLIVVLDVVAQNRQQALKLNGIHLNALDYRAARRRNDPVLTRLLVRSQSSEGDNRTVFNRLKPSLRDRVVDDRRSTGYHVLNSPQLRAAAREQGER